MEGDDSPDGEERVDRDADETDPWLEGDDDPW